MSSARFYGTKFIKNYNKKIDKIRVYFQLSNMRLNRGFGGNERTKKVFIVYKDATVMTKQELKAIITVMS